MSSNVNIKYVNHSMNLDQPSVFVFTKNEIPSFDALREGVAWRVINKVGRGSSCNFTFPISTEISASWNDGCCRTAMLPAVIGIRLCVATDKPALSFGPWDTPPARPPSTFAATSRPPAVSASVCIRTAAWS